MAAERMPFESVQGKVKKTFNFFQYGKYLIVPTLASGLFGALCSSDIYAAMPGSYLQIGTIAYSESSPRQKALVQLSGSPWPGVIDHLLQKPVTVDIKPMASIHINYPSLGNNRIDADIRHWVEGLANAFENNLDVDNGFHMAYEDNEELKPGWFLQDDDLYSGLGEEKDKAVRSFELWGDYKIDRPSSAAASITWEIWNYTGQPQGNLDILTLNYNLLNGQRLGLVDIFENPDHALELMSSWSRKVLAKRLGNLHDSMLLLGTEPLVENFSSLTLLPDGICINFQPFQVAPWEAGIQKVKMPLEELMPAAPLLSLWGK